MKIDDLKEVGKNSQLLPSYLRIVCRSRIDYTPNEIVEILRNDAMSRLSNWDLYHRYEFARHHYDVLRDYPPERALILVEAVRPNEIGHVCPFVRSEKKTSCFVCGMVRDFMHVVTYGTNPIRSGTSAAGATGEKTVDSSASRTQGTSKKAKAQAGTTSEQPIGMGKPV